MRGNSKAKGGLTQRRKDAKRFKSDLPLAKNAKNAKKSKNPIGRGKTIAAGAASAAMRASVPSPRQNTKKKAPLKLRFSLAS
jgi:hypothetical protein